MSRRIAMGVEYDGSRFLGWQLQRDEPTVQLAVETALSRVADQPVRVTCAGRTDSGVHATGQVIHFDTEANRSNYAWVMGGNTNLPHHVTLLWARIVTTDFNARFSATGRHYRYVILNRWTRPALGRDHYAWFHRPLDEARMRTAARHLIGEHDFTSFRAVACQAKHPVRTVHSINLQRSGQLITLDVHANAFLHHMVRNIAGSLMAVGCGDHEPGWVAEVLAAKDRRAAGITAPSGGLCLTGVDYAKEFGLPLGAGPAFPERG